MQGKKSKEAIERHISSIMLDQNNLNPLLKKIPNDIESINKIHKQLLKDKSKLEPVVNNLIKTNDTNFKGVGQPIRIALTGSKFGPGLYDIVIALGKEEVLIRLAEIIS